MKAKTINAIGLTLGLTICIIGAVGTLVWMLKFGLFAPRPPLPLWHTVLRFALALSAAVLFIIRRDVLERMTLVVGVVAAGASALFGVGVRGDTLSAVRIVAHLILYSGAAVVLGRMLLTQFRPPVNADGQLTSSRAVSNIGLQRNDSHA